MTPPTVKLYRVSEPVGNGKHEVFIVREEKLGEWRNKRVTIIPLCEYTPMVTPGGAP